MHCYENMLTFPSLITSTSSSVQIADYMFKVSEHKFLRLAAHISNEESMMQYTCTGKSICGLLVDQLILSQSTVGGNIL